jgi:hypothetical protein
MSAAAAEVIFVTGPKGCGKTRTTMLWTLRRSDPAFYLDWDQVASVLASEADLDGGGRTETPDRLYRRAATICTSMAKTVCDAGNDCAIVGAWLPDPQPYPEWEGAWAEAQELSPIVVVLLPALEVALARNSGDRSRRGRFGVPEDYVRESYKYGWERWHEHDRARVLDTSDLTLEQAAEAIEVAVRELKAPPVASGVAG